MFTCHVCDVRETEYNGFDICKHIIYSKRKPTQHKRKFGRKIAKCREISLELSQSATKFRSTIAECREISLELT